MSDEITTLRSQLERVTQERDEALRHVEFLQEKVAGEDCACSYDRPDDVCLTHSPLLERAVKERDEALAEVARLRAWIEAVRNNSALMAHAISERDRADKTERERDMARGAVLCAAEWFKGYADGHEAKGDLDKAKRNRDRENAMREALKDSPP